MKKATVHTGATDPTVFVTKNRQRVKQYGNNTVYLNDGDEFELELFNPTPNKLLAKISLNGNSIGNGIVLRPGERVFLERYIEESKKFIFETYHINPEDSGAKEAIKFNGIVDVEFYSEYVPAIWVDNTSDWTYTYGGTTNPNWSVGPTLTTNTGVFYCSAEDNNISGNCTADANLSYCDAASIEETGRIEKGSDSHQLLDYDNTTFNTYFSWNKIWNILPES